MKKTVITNGLRWAVLSLVAVSFGLLTAGCAQSDRPAQAPPPAVAGPAAVAEPATPAAALPVAVAEAKPAPAITGPAPARSALPAGGQDFEREARLLYRIAACGGNDPVPAGLEAVVESHCRALRPLMEQYRKRYVERASAFLKAIQPRELPRTIVYPFGGGDLLSALTTYPDLEEVTTLSLEHAGDPRRIDHADPKSLEENLARLRKGISGLLSLSDSTSENLMQLQRGEIPGQVAFFLVALAIHGQQPVGLRYFRIEPDGSLHYLSQEEIRADEGRLARNLNSVWKPPDFSVAFSNAELQFRPLGSGERAGVRVHRHIAANLMDGPLARDPRVIKHVEAKGRVTTMTKAASYVLWSSSFSRIRNYLLDHMEFMISDSTGIPPRFAKKAGFVQETYGMFSGPFLEVSMKDAEDFCALWNDQPRRELPFRYGYTDVIHQYHLLVTRRAPVPAR